MSSKGDSDQKSQKSDAGSEGGKTPRSQGSQSRSGSQAGSRAESRAASSQGAQTPRSKPGRHNKIYRCPPTPPPQDVREKEKQFVLDCNAVSSISTDYSRANPKLGPVIPPYNSQKDKHVADYFEFQGVNRTLKKTGQKTEDVPDGTSIEGPYMDYFHQEGEGHYYLSRRNANGAGRSTEVIDGHAQFMQGVKPVIGPNGPYGFRRNTPWLRQMPSPFGTASTSPTH